MHTLLQQLVDGLQFTRNISKDAPRFLHHHGCPKTAAHVADVAAEAGRLAARFGLPSAQAETAAWLHDISTVWPDAERLSIARELGVEVLPEEDILPMIIHQKLSVVIAREIFQVHDPAILSAIGCHTTLKLDATSLDMCVFVADKIAWDQVGQPPYLAAVVNALDSSLAAASLAYLSYLMDRRDQLKVLHPWAEAAYIRLSGG